MEKYTKHHSNYIRTKKHQTLNDGSTIFERDWVTIGSQLNFGKGKIPFYNDGNFLFTTSPLPTYQKKFKNGVLVGVWCYDDVKDSVNQNKNEYKNEFTSDIRSFCYYGSCVELLRATIEDIIKTFPGNITLSRNRLELEPLKSGDDYRYIDGFIINNPFKIDLIHKHSLGKIYDNALRWMTLSWNCYTINGKPIESYDVSNIDIDEQCPENSDYRNTEKPVVTIIINQQYKLYGYLLGNDIVFCYTPQSDGENFEIKPNDEIINGYFEHLQGLQKLLLNTKTKPLYKNYFITPIEHKGQFFYYKRSYIWPSNGYSIDISSEYYEDFLTDLFKMCNIYDGLWTNNLYRRMTHESIKNYDWSYTQHYNDGEEIDNINGGERMHDVLNIIGHVFDKIKFNIDVIKRKNRVTYDNDRNMSHKQIKDRLLLNGWDIQSVIPKNELVKDNITIGDDIVKKYMDKWYNTIDENHITLVDIENEFMKRLLMSSLTILRTKGTIHSLLMLFGLFGYDGEEDFNIQEEYYTVKPIQFDKKLDNGKTFGDTLIELNEIKNDTLYREIEYDSFGIPVSSIIKDNIKFNEKEENGKTIIESTIERSTYIIPFYNSKLVYDGDIYFQNKGGWCYNMKEGSDNVINPYNFNETMSYLHCVPKIEDLLKINANLVQNGDIYYVSNVNDYIFYSENIEDLKSHFFVLKDDFNPDLFSSWKSIDLDSKNKEDEDIVKKAIYLDNIINDNNGNNPHVGYGYYDNGKTFIDYMKLPFKYAIDNGYFNDEVQSEAKKITFDISEPIKTKNIGDKIKILKKDEEFENYYLNSKVVRITLMNKNLQNSIFFKKYFREVILKYITQVIPSTAIILLQNFD